MAKCAIVSNGKVENIVENDEHYCIAQGWIIVDNTVGIGDLYSDGKFTKRTKTVNSYPVSPIRFKLLFTQDERLALKTARAEDIKLEDFYLLLDDPRLTTVDLFLPSTQTAISYCLNKIKTALNYNDAKVTARYNEIINGVMK